MIEFWKAGGPGSLTPTVAAQQLESEGWDGAAFMDSQSLGADPYVLMSAWAGATDRIKLSTGVTNPLTRHPAVTANAAASLQAVSGGRAVLGIGRGDSALAFLGLAPVPIRRFEQTLVDLQALLSGGEMSFDTSHLIGQTDSADTLTLGTRPDSTRLEWLPPDLPKVPLDVAATGPRVIEIGSRLADRVTFSVGAAPERLSWALALGRKAELQGRELSAAVEYGAQIVVVCHKQVDAVRDAASRIVLPLARFQVISAGTAAGPKQVGDDEAYDTIRRRYEMNKHSNFDEDKLVDEAIDFEFVRRFAVVGTPEHCVERLLELTGLGISRFVVFGPGVYDDGTRGQDLFLREVMPAVRAAA